MIDTSHELAREYTIGELLNILGTYDSRTPVIVSTACLAKKTLHNPFLKRKMSLHEASGGTDIFMGTTAAIILEPE